MKDARAWNSIISPGVKMLFRMSFHLGNVRVPEVVAAYERKSAESPLSGVSRLIAGPRSTSSH